MSTIDAVRGVVGAVAGRGPVFRVERQDGGIAHLVMDDPERRLNVLGERAIEDLERALGDLAGMGGLTGVLVRSCKPGSVVAGAAVAVMAPWSRR